MSKAYEEMQKAQEYLTSACGCYSRCAECPMNLSMGDCVLLKLKAAIKEQSIRDLRAEAYGEVM